MMLAITRACYACALAIGIATGAMSQPSESVDPRGELTLAQALDAALRGNPDLRASTYELTAAQARIVQASLRPNAELGVELENFAGSGMVHGTEALETTLSLSQAVELGDKRNLRVSAAEMDLELVSIEQRARELDVLAEVTRRFIDVVAAQERVRIAADAAALTRNALDAIVARVEAGRSPEAERSRARIALTRAEIERRQADSQLMSARVALAAHWGRPEPQFTTAQATLLNLPPVLTFAALNDKVEQTPDLLRFASEARLRDAELRLARAQARPNIAFSLGVRRFEESNDTGLVAGFSMALPTSDRNQGAIREAHARLAQSHALREAAQLRIRASLFALYQELTATRARVDSLRADAVPQAQLALDQMRAGYERGRFSFLELAAAQEELLALRSAEIDAAADYHRLVGEVERLTGAALTQTNR
jgi:outer membrane protein, heavy metal efflux system